MNEEFSFDIDEENIQKLRDSLELDKLEEIHKRFENGTETEDDLINHIQHYLLRTADGFELNIVEYKYFQKLVNLYKKEKERNIASQKVIVELNDKLQNESVSKDKIRCRLHDTNNWLDSGRYANYGLNPYELNAVKEELEKLLEDEE